MRSWRCRRGERTCVYWSAVALCSVECRLIAMVEARVRREPVTEPSGSWSTVAGLRQRGRAGTQEGRDELASKRACASPLCRSTRAEEGAPPQKGKAKQLECRLTSLQCVGLRSRLADKRVDESNRRRGKKRLRLNEAEGKTAKGQIAERGNTNGATGAPRREKREEKG